MKRIRNFNDYFNESRLDEGLFSWIKANIVDKLKGWTGQFFRDLKDGKIRTIPNGPKKGKPIAMLFTPENGSIVDQIKSYYGSAHHSSPKVNEKILTEQVVGLEYPGGTIQDVNVSELKNDIRELYLSKTSGERAKPIFIYGAPGIGKTEIVGAVCDELGIQMINLDIQFMNPEDFQGIPSVHTIHAVELTDNESGQKTLRTGGEGEGFTRANPPAILPRDNGTNGKGGIIFMDEMNRANKIVLNVLMQFVQMGRIGSYKLPSNWVIIGAGNRSEDDPDANIADFGSALANRFTIVNFVPKFEDWADWASKEMKIFPELVAFLNWNRLLWHKNNPSGEKGIIFPTPRSWTDGAKILAGKIKVRNLKSWTDIPQDDLVNIFRKEVGLEAAGAFGSYLQVIREVTDEDINNIIKDPGKSPLIEKAKKDRSTRYGLQSMVLGRIDKYNAKGLLNIMKYFSRYGEPEALSWLYQQILKKFPQFVATSGDAKDPDTAIKVEAGSLMIKDIHSKLGLPTP